MSDGGWRMTTRKNSYKTYFDIPVWQLSHQLVLRIHELTKKFPNEEKFALSSQIRRAAISVPSNIVEGINRQTTKELIQFLFHSRGSLLEAQYQLLLARDFGYIKGSEYENLFNDSEEIFKQISAWIISLKRKL